MANRYVERYAISPILRDSNKTTMSYYLIPVRMAIIKKSRNNKCRKGFNEKGPCELLVRIYTGSATKETSTVFSQNLKIELHMIQQFYSGYSSQRNEDSNSKRYMHLHIHYSIIYNSQNMKVT